MKSICDRDGFSGIFSVLSCLTKGPGRGGQEAHSPWDQDSLGRRCSPTPAVPAQEKKGKVWSQGGRGSMVVKPRLWCFPGSNPGSLSLAEYLDRGFLSGVSVSFQTTGVRTVQVAWGWAPQSGSAYARRRGHRPWEASCSAVYPDFAPG